MVQRTYLRLPIRPLTALVGVSLSLGAAGSLLAQTAPPRAAPDAGQLLEQIRPAAPLPEAARPVLPPTPRVPVPTDDTQVAVSGFTFSGNTVFTSDQLQAIVASSLAAQPQPQSATFGALQRAANSITQAYAARGYLLARAVIARQDLANNPVLRIQILEGTLGSINLPPAAAANVAELATATLAAQGIQPGTALQQSPLERAVLLLTDRLGSQASVALSAGSTLGSTDLGVQTPDSTAANSSAAQPWRAQLSFDNHGNRYTGEWRAGLEASLLNPTTLGDALSLRSLLSSGLQFVGLAYQRPAGYDGWRLGANASALRYQLCCQFAVLNAKGDAQTLALTARYPLLLSSDRSVYADAAINERRSLDTTVAGVVANKSVRSVQVGISFNDAGALAGVLSGGALPSGLLQNGQLQLTSGSVDLSRTPGNAAQDAVTAQTAGGFSKLRLDYSAVAPLNASTQVSARFATQAASKNLDSSERLSLGGANTLRAYPAGEATGDAGWLLNLEARYIFSSWSRPDSLGYNSKSTSKEAQNASNSGFVDGNWFVSGFIDAGSIKQRQTLWANALAAGQPNRYSLAGAGLSLGYSAPGWQTSLTLARTLGSNPAADALGNNSDGRSQRTRVLLQISKSL